MIKAIKRTDDYSSILDSVLNKIVAYTVFNESGGNEKITPQTYSALEKRHPFNKISFIMDNAFLHILSNREKLVSSDYLAQFLTSLTNVNLILKDVFGLENKPFMEIKFLDFDSNTTEDFALAKDINNIDEQVKNYLTKVLPTSGLNTENLKESFDFMKRIENVTNMCIEGNLDMSIMSDLKADSFLGQTFIKYAQNFLTR